MMLSEHPAYLLTLLDDDYYETIDFYQPLEEYVDVVAEYLSGGWRVRLGGYWTLCQPAKPLQTRQGWKIHLSATERSAIELLRRTVPLIVGRETTFKFCSDRRMLRLSTNKNWTRTGAGKFMTIYPETQEAFEAQIEELHDATRDLLGPYILSDRPYKDSKVVFYRYGEHDGYDRLDLVGRRRPGILDPDGRWVSDDRRPYFHLPPWVSDPFAEHQPLETPGEDGVFLNDRYRVRKALKFLATGGIYLGTDERSGEEVVLREVRPVVRGGGEEDDGFRLLRKEARILEKLGPTGYLPQFIDLFQEWEHLFLVQERLDAESLWGYAIGFSHGSSALRPADVFRRLREAIEKIVNGLAQVHDRGVVLRDLTRNNVLFTKDDRVKFIDLEFAYELDRDDPTVPGWTPGYASPQQLRFERPTPAEDHYALGVLILDMIAFTAPGFALNRRGVMDSFRLTLGDYGLPAELYEVVEGLTEEEVGRRWDLDRTVDALSSIPVPTASFPVVPVGTTPPRRPKPAAELLSDLRDTVDGIADFLLAKADFKRDDRLWPAQAEVFSTNPVSLQLGAAGVAAFLHRACGEVPESIVQWIIDHTGPATCPPGLTSGLSGVAWTLLDLGAEDAAREVLTAAGRSELLFERAELYYGAAGWGLTHLHFYRQTGDPAALLPAVEAGDFLLQSRKESKEGVWWEAEGQIPLGFGHGGSGVATFLIYLDAVAPGQGYLEAAIAAIDFEISQREQIDDEVLWFPRVGAPPGAPKSPHLRHGTAGVGTAVLRAYLATGEERFRAFADVCATTTADRQTNKLWHDYGLSGFGQYLLDLYRLLGDENYLHNAFYLAEAILPHRIVRDEGFAFAGEDLVRICCDLSGGSAGIGLFLHRLLHPDTDRFLMLDTLLTETPEATGSGGGEGAEVPGMTAAATSPVVRES